MEMPARAPVAELAAAPAAGVAAEEAQPEPSLTGDAAGSASEEEMPKSETKDEADRGEIEELQDLFASSCEDGEDPGGDGGARARMTCPTMWLTSKARTYLRSSMRSRCYR